MNLAMFNMGLPMIFPAMMLMLAALIPVSILEAFILTKNLSIRFQRSLWLASVANVISTIFGIPVTWFLLFIVQMITGGTSAYEMNSIWGKFLSVTWQAPWIMPPESETGWVVPAAMLFLLIPFFLGSWYIEYVVMRQSLAWELYDLLAQSTDFIEPEYDAKMTLLDGFAPRIRVTVRNANLYSYALLGLFIVLLFGFGLATGN